MPNQTDRYVCPYYCPDSCGLLVEVKNGYAISVKGDPALLICWHHGHHTAERRASLLSSHGRIVAAKGDLFTGQRGWLGSHHGRHYGTPSGRRSEQRPGHPLEQQYSRDQYPFFA